jgi:hypothetical protein
MSIIKIFVSATVSPETNLTDLRKRIADHIRLIANPVRDDQGIKVVHDVSILETSSAKNTKTE